VDTYGPAESIDRPLRRGGRNGMGQGCGVVPPIGRRAAKAATLNPRVMRGVIMQGGQATYGRLQRSIGIDDLCPPSWRQETEAETENCWAIRVLTLARQGRPFGEAAGKRAETDATGSGAEAAGWGESLAQRYALLCPGHRPAARPDGPRDAALRQCYGGDPPSRSLPAHPPGHTPRGLYLIPDRAGFRGCPQLPRLRALAQGDEAGPRGVRDDDRPLGSKRAAFPFCRRARRNRQHLPGQKADAETSRGRLGGQMDRVGDGCPPELMFRKSNTGHGSSPAGACAGTHRLPREKAGGYKTTASRGDSGKVKDRDLDAGPLTEGNTLPAGPRFGLGGVSGSPSRPCRSCFPAAAQKVARALGGGRRGPHRTSPAVAIPGSTTRRAFAELRYQGGAESVADSSTTAAAKS